MYTKIVNFKEDIVYIISKYEKLIEVISKTPQEELTEIAPYVGEKLTDLMLYYGQIPASYLQDVNNAIASKDQELLFFLTGELLINSFINNLLDRFIIK